MISHPFQIRALGAALIAFVLVECESTTTTVPMPVMHTEAMTAAPAPRER